MHLSLLSDSFISDSLDDAEPAFGEFQGGETHCDGLVRGIAFLGIASILIVLLFLSGLVRSTDAEPAFARFIGGVPSVGPTTTGPSGL